MTDIRGSFVVDPDADADNVVMLRTQRIGLMRVELNAPVTGGLLVLGSSSSELMLTLNIAEVRVGNPLMQAAARALVGSSDSSLLRFDAEGADDDLLRFLGTARAGDVEVPMEITAAVGPLGASLPVVLSGWATFTDVSIPLPGMGRVSTIEADISGRVAFLPA
ncbi:MAG: hypothetical protein F2842_07190 [Actinobacteria bacterium]|uniref:Unannotated protein n=1 Tax=freshwater metagenome TaxID=449393 RepID=A0A6J7K4R7_9ZZZZ|nr:hypothetical protein [Actinomycetota bacterium]MSW41979.1 hypothetical protein [Actinomycetota bacterium]